MHIATAPSIAPDCTPRVMGDLFSGMRETSTAYKAQALHRTGPSAAATVRKPRLIRSVVAEAGLGRFVYLQGKSGKRYVFSSITADQAPLYDNVLFAATRPGGDVVCVAARFDALKLGGAVLYVHLLDGDENEHLATLRDLT